MATGPKRCGIWVEAGWVIGVWVDSAAGGFGFECMLWSNGLPRDWSECREVGLLGLPIITYLRTFSTQLLEVRRRRKEDVDHFEIESFLP